MSKVNLTIVYYSSTGTNYQLAKWAEEGAISAGANVRVVRAAELAPAEAIAANPLWKAHVDATKDIPVATAEDIEWADAVLFSVPTRFGNMAAQMKQFIDTLGGLWASGNTINKVVSGMTSAQNAHGGQEATILSLYTSMLHWGAIIAAPGYTDEAVIKVGGNPYGLSVTAGSEGIVEDAEDVANAAKHQVKRMISIAAKLK